MCGYRSRIRFKCERRREKQRSAIFAIKQVAHGVAAGGVGFALIFALVSVHGTLRDWVYILGLTALRTAVGEPRLAGFEFELLAAGYAGFDRESHLDNFIHSWL